MKRLIFFLLAFGISTSAFATTRYISPSGAGTMDGSTAGNALAYASAAGFNTALAASSAGDTIHFENGRYALATMTINKSGSAGNPITIEGEGFADDAVSTIFVGSRELPTVYDSVGAGNADTGGTAFSFSAGASYITIQNIRVTRVQYIFYALAYNNNYVTITNVFGQNYRTGLWIYGDAGCANTPNVYTCANGSHDWTITNFDGEYVSKNHSRIERGVHAIDFVDCDVDGKFTGNGDFGMGFMNGTSAVAAPVYDISYTNCTSTGWGYSSSTSYDNGDGFVSEMYVSDITFTNCSCLDTWDGCFDLKGGPYTFNKVASFRDGIRPFKFWHGPINITNAIIGYNFPGADSTDSNYHHLTQRANGSKGAFWASAVIAADKVTLINNEYPVRFGCANAGSTCGNHYMNFTSGNGTLPTVSSLVTGGTSGAKAKIAGYDGNGTSGMLYVFNVGTFTNGETITDTGGFSATLGNAVTATTAWVGSKFTITNSILALTAPYVNYSTAAADECTVYSSYNGQANTFTEAAFLAGSGNVIWKQNVSGDNPGFADPDNSEFLGCNNDFDPGLEAYKDVKGYYHNAADTCVQNPGQEPVTCPDCSYVTASSITFS